MIHTLRHSLAFLLYSFLLFTVLRFFVWFFFSPEREKSYWRKPGQAQQGQGAFPKEMIPSVMRPVSWASAHSL